MKAAYLLTDSMYSLVVSDSSGKGAGNGTLGRGFAGVREVVGRDGTTGARSTGRGGVSKVSIRIGVWTSGVDTSSRTGVEVDPEQGLVLPVVAGLLQTSWHPTRGPVFLRILPSLGSSKELSASGGFATTP